MDDEDFNLIVQINYDNKSFSLENYNIIDINEVIKHSIKNFKIDKELQKYIILTYKDEDGDINIIRNKEDIINSSKEIGSTQYLAKLDLEIVLDEYNDKNKEKIENFSENINMEENEELKRLEEINESKDKKIIELEKKIIKLEKESKNLNSFMKNNLYNSIKIGNNFESDKNSSEKSYNKNEIKNIINDLFNSEKEYLENCLKKFKEDLFLKINNNLQKDNKTELLNNILDDISFIKENLEINMKENKAEKNEINMDFNKQFFNNMPMPMMKPSKLYRCQNCNCCFMFNECFNISNNTTFKEHNFKLDKQENNEHLNQNEQIINNNENINIDNIPENIEEKNENNIKKINILNVKKNELVGKEKEEKKEEIKKENIKEKEEKKEEKKEEENKEEENGEEDDDFEDDLKFQNILKNYFFNDKEDLKADEPTRNELNEIKNYYKILQEKNKEFQISQESFIIEVDKEISKITNKNILYKVKSRKQKIQRLIENFMNEINQENNRNNRNKNKRRRNNYYNKK